MSGGLLDVNGIVAFSSGLLSFFSPCILPMVPSYLIFISGITFDHYSEVEFRKYRKTVFLHSLAFICGFSAVFISLGLSSSLIGRSLAGAQVYITRIGGMLLILMGLFYLDLLKVPFLNYERMIHLKQKPVGLAGSFLVGVTFSVGWTPCVGPALSSILIIASTTENVFEGGYLLAFYSAGLAIPFILSSLVFDRLFSLLKRYGSVVRYSVKIMGVLLLIIGLLLFTSYYNLVVLKLGQLFY